MFFGLGDSDKTTNQLISFGFIIFAELVIYLSTLAGGMIESKKVTEADIISAGVLYAIASFIINLRFSYVVDTKTLIVINVAAILAYLLLLVVVVAMKKNKK